MCSWPALVALFAQALALHGHVDHVFANAGIGGYRTDYLAPVAPVDPATGALLEPSTLTLDVNLKAAINTAYLGLHHMRHNHHHHQQQQQQQRRGGSVVLTASASSFQRFRNADYTIAKHGVLGFMRGVVPNLQAQGLPMRVNCIAPSFTRTGLVSDEGFRGMGREDLLQAPEVAARSAAVLMADGARQGQLVYSAGGRMWEIEESRLLPTAAEIVGVDDEDKVSWPPPFRVRYFLVLAGVRDDCEGISALDPVNISIMKDGGVFFSKKKKKVERPLVCFVSLES